MPDTLSVVVDASRLRVVELGTTGAEEVSRVSASVALEAGDGIPTVPVGTEDRLNVIPNSAVLVRVLLALLGILAVAVNDGCCDEVHVKFVPSPGLENISVSLAGTCIPELFDIIVAVTAAEAQDSVETTAAPVRELNKEKATVLKFSAGDWTLEIYTVEKVVVIVPEAVGAIEVVCVALLVNEGRDVSMLLDLVNVSDAENDEPLLDDVMVGEAYVEVEFSDVELGPAVSEVCIAALANEVVEVEANGVGCCDGTV